MSVLDLLNKPWAITPHKLDQMCAIYERHQAGEGFDAKSVQAALGLTPRAKQDDGTSYDKQEGVAILDVHGVLAKRMDMFLAISDGTSTSNLVSAVAEAMADPEIHSILLAIDSPGGEVDGTQQIGDAIAASTKPTMAWIDGTGCSAAYWIAAQCGSIYAASDTTNVGSISVLQKHTDYSKANDNAGKSVTYITSGKYKAAANPDSPLSQDDRAYLQGKIDYLCDIFVDAVAEGRGVSADTVWADMGEGKTFFAQQAIDAGLINGIASEADCIAMLVSKNAAASAAITNGKPGAKTMFKAFETEAEYQAEISAAEERGRTAAVAAAASVDTPTESKQKLQSAKLATDIKAHQKRAKAEGRNLTAVQAMLELEAQASAEAA